MIDIQHERNITNALMLEYLDLWKEFDITSVDDKATRKYYNELMDLISSQLDESIRWINSNEAKEYFASEAKYHENIFNKLETSWDNILNGSYDNVDELLDAIYDKGKELGYKDMREHIHYTKTDKLALQFVKDYNFNLIQRIDDDVRNEIKNKIITGILSGENPNNITPKILNIAEEKLTDSIFTPRQRAVMIAKTEVSRAQNTGMLQSYVNEGYTEVKILTAEDNNVCYTCLTYAYEFNNESEVTYENRGEEKIHNISKLIKGGLYPPFHPLCRCTYISVWESKEEPPKNPFIVNLSLWNFKNINQPDSDIPFKQLSKNKIPHDFPELFKKELYNFDEYYGEKYREGKRLEFGYLANLTTGEVSKYFTSNMQNHINFNQSNIVVYKNDELIATHTHLTRIPFNYKDFKAFFVSSQVYSKYMVVHTPNDIFIAEFNSEAFKNREDIIDATEKDYMNMMERNMKFQSDEFGAEALWDNYLKNEILNKYIVFRRISK